jgi:hypothetical protein
MALVSPGVEVSIVDESQYAPTSSATVPLVVVATASNKTTPAGTVAEGTLASNAGDLYVLTSQRDVVNFFGTPNFYTSTSGSALHGYELNEYGLQTAYSLLGSSSRAYVLRADVDLGQLVGLSGRPTAAPEDMTYWLDLASSRFGMHVWSKSTNTFTAVTPSIITSTNDLSGGAPKTSIGQIGDYVVVGTNNALPVYYKNRSNSWVLVGDASWMRSFASVTGTEVNPTLTAADAIAVNGTVVTLTGVTVSQTATDINNAAIAGITADAVDGRLEIYVDDDATNDAVVLANDTGTPLADLGITAGTYARPMVAHAAHTSVPAWKTTDTTPRPTGSLWIKTTSVDFGADFTLYRYNSTSDVWQTINGNLYKNDADALKAMDPTNGGSSIPVGSVYYQYDTSENGTATYRLFERAATGATVIEGFANPTLTTGNQFTVSVSQKNSATFTTPVTVTLSGTTATDLVSDILALGITGLSAEVNGSGEPLIKHTQGGTIILNNTLGTPLDDAGFDATDIYARYGNNGSLVVSNWTIATSNASSTTYPSADPTNGTLWYWSDADEADIMINDGTNWVGYKTVTSDARGFNLSNTDEKGPIFSATEPTEQVNEDPLVYGDLWIDTSELENFPKIYRWQPVDGVDKWVELNNADQTSENGILFADARFAGDTTTDVVTGTITSIADLLTNSTVDLDCPSASLYPKGTLLFNTRRSSFNVKEYRRNYFNVEDFPGETLPTEKNAWVTVSGARENGHANFGRKAQRHIIVAAMKAALDANTEVREEQREFNLIAAPGYPELISNMVQLNNDRKQTAFVVGDSSMRVASEGTDLGDWLANSGAVATDAETSLTVSDPYVGVWYPALLANDLNGNSIAMPSSYGVLRMMIRNDQVSFPWFAPAGTRRGIIDNATRLGYLNEQSEFVSIGVRQGVRDQLYENRVNPLMQTPQTGIVAYGQKTRSADASALNRVNVARLTAYMRAQLDKIVRPFLFEPNDKITRDQAKAVVESFCNNLVAKRGIYDYIVVCDDSNNTADRIDRNELYIDVAIEPVKAVEFIYIPVRIRNTGDIEAGI